ncbi:MAG TPA: DUF3313 family protein [Casimicrobiaceae bacterium]|nr:DUF3313 family protein [Casimicrobiaceae bacterium]
MSTKTSFIALILGICSVPFAAQAQAPVPMSSDGMVAVQSTSFDEFYLRPKTDLASYRKVIVEPAQVSMQKGWLKSINGTRDVTRWLTQTDVRGIVDAANTAMSSSVATAFKGRGYEVATVAGPGVLRLLPSVPDLWVNAPGIAPYDPARYASVDAGDATLILEARDSVSGTLLARVVDRRTARQTFRLNQTTTASNYFWFETMSDRWATNVAREFEAVQVQP